MSETPKSHACKECRRRKARVRTYIPLQDNGTHSDLVASSVHASYLCARNASNGVDIAYMKGRRAVPLRASMYYGPMTLACSDP